MFPKQRETYFQDVIDFETLHNFEVSHFFDPFSDVAKKNNNKNGTRFGLPKVSIRCMIAGRASSSRRFFSREIYME